MNRPTHNPTRAPTGHPRRAFTLLELMISIALVLILILGVNTVFSLTSQTVGAGNALGTMYRANQSFHGVIYQDLKSMVVGSDEPCFVIVNQRRNAFRNAVDRDADKDGNPATWDVDGDGVETGVPNGSYNHRNCRIDKLCFFARGKFFRQTGSGGRFWDADPRPNSSPSIPLSSDQAWIKYGYLSLPDNAATPGYQTPGGGTPQTNPNNYYSSQWVLGRQVTLLVSETTPPSFASGVYVDNSSTAQPLHPLDPDAVAKNETAEQLQFNRYDVAITRMSDYRQKIANLTNPTGFKQQYWLLHGDFYFRGNNVVTGSPNPASVARTLPVFVSAATHFMVEFAGDFVEQDASTGLAISGGADGVIDFMIDGNGVRKTRWYGYNRDLDGNGVINSRFDIVPVANSFRGTSPQPQPFERVVNVTSDPNRYIVGWGADSTTADSPRPTMLRIILTVDDPASRVGNGETFEYVGNLK